MDRTGDLAELDLYTRAGPYTNTVIHDGFCRAATHAAAAGCGMGIVDRAACAQRFPIGRRGVAHVTVEARTDLP
jgi:hypothetical protein